MALSNISKEHVNKLLVDLNSNNLNNQKIIQSVQRNSNNYGKLKTLLRQMAFIKNEINEIVNESIESEELDKVDCKFNKIPGKHYYLYRKIENDKLFFSMLEPEIWEYSKNNEYVGKYLFDYDLTLNRV